MDAALKTVSSAILEASAGHVVVVIPTLNEEHSIADVVRAIPRDIVSRIIVADGGSSDATAARAEDAGADVVHAGRGYGRACLAATMAAEGADIVVFMDGDGADDPQAIARLVDPIRAGHCDFVIGSRARGQRQPGSIAWHQLAAGRLAGWGMRLLYGVHYTDMCAFRAIRRDALLALGMCELSYGWNIEMQMRAARAGLRVLEIPVDYHRRRGGRSKVAGSLSGSIRAGARIVATFVRVATEARRSRRAHDPVGRWRHGRSRLPLFSALLCAVALLAPAVAHARDLVVYGEPTLEKALKSVGKLWQARTGTRVNVFVASTGLSLAQIERGARCDVIFALPGAAMDEATRNKVIHGDTVRRVLRNDLVLIGAGPAATPPGGGTPADIGRLIAGKTLAIPDPERDAAGARAVVLLRKIGIGIDGNKSVAVAESSAGVVSMLAANKGWLGIVYVTDATTDFGRLVALPTSELPPIDYVVAQARDPVMDTQPFIAFLQSAEAKAAFKSAGLQSVDEGNAAVDSSAGRQR